MQKTELKTSILTHSERLHARKIRLRWLIAISSLPLFGMVTAFGIAPQTDTAQVTIQTVVENLPAPASLTQADSQDVVTNYWRDERIERGDTVASILQRLGVNDEQIALFLKAPEATRALIQIKSGKRIQAQVTDTGNLVWLRNIAADGTMLEISADAGTFKTAQQAAQLESHTVMKSGEIRNSLFGATDAAGIPDSVATQMAEIFSTDIDFHQDLRRGDRFNVVYEVFSHNGVPVMTGRVVAAEFTNAGHTYRAVFSDVANSKGEYYSPDGKPLKKAFLRSPLAFSRISSGFEMRFHPILKQWRQHKGIDYAAPTGTKVMAIADATVEFVGQQSGYGNFIVLKHNGNYSTAYGHLSAFAKGLHKGEKISQGDLIGYVGMTGWATGPHLHYEFRIAGVATNPLTANIPTAYPIATQFMPKFRQETQPLVAQLNLLDGTNLVAME
ncbi:peptidoglycan DD-metalloendopeptidase family protein [Sulfuriferula thiophila]|uniref:peptidoglycan DD-metalloendopeptidase family protein n=1 Tax=Sulfuriferula thiophila TaxID=1781211 RepID=UPI000F60D709|nr:peptidoglycan DD-metalloendopeptidase family protein [Sulfuriferula thiophila]